MTEKFILGPCIKELLIFFRKSKLDKNSIYKDYENVAKKFLVGKKRKYKEKILCELEGDYEHFQNFFKGRYIATKPVFTKNPDLWHEFADNFAGVAVSLKNILEAKLKKKKPSDQ